MLQPFDRGKKDFKEGNVTSIYPVDSMPYREWLRGFNQAYFANLEKVEEREHRERSSQIQ